MERSVHGEKDGREKRAAQEAPWSRATLERASARGTKKRLQHEKDARSLESLLGRGLPDQLERGCHAIRLARQAGPGPRI
jgi:hypothetical protein